MSRGIITIKSYGSTKNIDGFFKRTRQRRFIEKLEYYGRLGVDALARETPVDTGNSANSWGYFIERDKNSVKLYWTNDEVAGNTPVVILIQYGHATGSGVYVEPHDFINPVTKNIFEEITNSIWEEVTRP